jgi:hypothetical protein
MPENREKNENAKKVVIVAVVTEDYDATKGFSAFVSELRKKYSEVIGTNQISLMII